MIEEVYALDRIEDNPFQLRDHYDAKKIQILADNILQVGLIQPPIGRLKGDRVQIAVGHRRKRAFEYLCEQGHTSFSVMPVLIDDISDRQMFEYSASENLKRLNFTVIEKAKALKQYMADFHATSEDAGKLFHVRDSTVRGIVRLLKLPEDVQERLASGELPQYQARKLISKPKEEYQSYDHDSYRHFSLRNALKLFLFGSNRADITDEEIFETVKRLRRRVDRLEKKLNMVPDDTEIADNIMLENL